MRLPLRNATQDVSNDVNFAPIHKDLDLRSRATPVARKEATRAAVRQEGRASAMGAQTNTRIVPRRTSRPCARCAVRLDALAISALADRFAMNARDAFISSYLRKRTSGR
jgi:hypothetical protein